MRSKFPIERATATEVTKLQRAVMREQDVIAQLGSDAASRGEALTAYIRDIVESWPYLALIIDRHRDIVAASATGVAWGPPGENLLRRLVGMPTNYPGWDRILPAVTTRLRHDLITHPEDPRYRELAGELGEISADFRTLWRDRPRAQFAEVGQTVHSYGGRGVTSYHLPVDPRRDVRAVLSVPVLGSPTTVDLIGADRRRGHLS